MNKYILIIIILTFFSCKKDEQLVSNNLKIQFTHTVSGNSLVLACCSGENLNYTNSSNEKYNIETLKYIITNISLHTEENIEIIKDIHLIDAEENSTTSFEIESLEDLNYTKISFTFGLDSTMNQPNAYINSSQNIHNQMIWPASINTPTVTAYHYMKLEGVVDSALNGYKTHTGPTDGMDFSFTKAFPISINDGSINNKIISINMEIDNWFNNPENISFSSYGLDANGIQGIMQNMIIQQKIQVNGNQDVFSVSVNE
tara:strand:+ start:4822 stop:5595 length:774 start_codon:yes stop_codon:yes gene_type:complete